VLVADVEEEGPAARAGVRAGDGLIAVDGRAVGDVSEAVGAIASLPSGVPRELVVARDGQHVSISVEAIATLARPDVPVSRTSAETGPPVHRLFAPDVAARFGLPLEAVVLAIDGRALSERAALASLRRTRGPRLLYLAHGGERFFAAVEARP
jgi:S1-C subfamily serine protease